jgi:hypothetical protein
MSTADGPAWNWEVVRAALTTPTTFCSYRQIGMALAYEASCRKTIIGSSPIRSTTLG